jgi:hypothetical protein
LRPERPKLVISAALYSSSAELRDLELVAGSLLSGLTRAANAAVPSAVGDSFLGGGTAVGVGVFRELRMRGEAVVTLSVLDARFAGAAGVAGGEDTLALASAVIMIL